MSKTFNSTSKFSNSSNVGFSNKQLTGSKRQDRTVSIVYCTSCHKLGHTIDRCYFLHGFPSHWKGSKEKKVAATAQNDIDQTNSDSKDGTPSVSFEQYHQFLEFLKTQKHNEHSGTLLDGPNATGQAHLAGKLCLVSCLNTDWLLDSGASDHICSDLSCFTTYQFPSGSDNTITIPNGTQVQIKHIGSVQISKHIQLHDVLHVPDFKFNLISVHKLCRDMNSELRFTHDNCFIQSQIGPPILLGRLHGRLYKVDPTGTSDPVRTTTIPHSPSCLSVVERAKLWHLRFGHLPFHQFKYVLPELNFPTGENNFICQICPAARQAKLSFPISGNKSTEPFALIYVDTWGPLSFKTHSVCNKFLTIVDDCTRFTWVHLMKYKTDAVPVLNNFARFVATQFVVNI
ncbi:Retrovirus-related Pol polyprotein from transposon RE1 [Bienertia sinuspersici]